MSMSYPGIGCDADGEEEDMTSKRLQGFAAMKERSDFFISDLMNIVERLQVGSPHIRKWERKAISECLMALVDHISGITGSLEMWHRHYAVRGQMSDELVEKLEEQVRLLQQLLDRIEPRWRDM